MKQIRKRLTYANVMSSLAVFLVLGGATAFAASQLGKKTVGAKQLKANAVTTAKIKKNAVSAKKIKNGAVDGTKIADGSVTGADINGPSTPFSQVVARVRSSAQVAFSEGQVYPLGSYTQAAGEDDQLLAGITVNFAASCTSPRSVEALLLMDPANPSKPVSSDVIGLGFVEDTGAGALTKQVEFSSFLEGGSGMARLAPAAAANHSLSVFLIKSKCETGSGVTVSGGALDVIGTK